MADVLSVKLHIKRVNAMVFLHQISIASKRSVLRKNTKNAQKVPYENDTIQSNRFSENLILSADFSALSTQHDAEYKH